MKCIYRNFLLVAATAGIVLGPCSCQRIRPLDKITRGLTYTSEVDSHITPFSFQSDKKPSEMTADEFLKLFGDNVENLEFLNENRVFEDLSRQSETDFDELESFVRINLTDIRCFAIGTATDKRIYVAGTDSGGNVTGFYFLVVET